MRKWTIFGLLLLLPAVSVPAQPGEGERPRERRDPREFTHLNDEGFPLNVDPQIISAADAEIGDADMVMGVVLNGETRAYPVNYMNGPKNEVVNDELGGEVIASTW